uniref:Ribosomal protein S11 n=1 Tax=Kumanoa ambigua TaxID=644273 RepID=A0A343UXV5_9FLOR|nr:ribosomal protein S11 [Kumanoa ambigua]AVK39512.1 ribosomal protein S11 [Kumanoa ambigua]
MQLKIKKTAIVFILFTTNNVIYLLTDLKGNVLFNISVGSFKSLNLKKTTPSLICSSMIYLIRYICENNLLFLHIKIKGLSKSKRLIVKTLQQSNLKILSLQDLTSFPHNGCRKKSKRYI